MIMISKEGFLKKNLSVEGINLKQNQDRFKRYQISEEIPGQSSYQVNHDKDAKQKAKVTFCKPRNNVYFNELKLHQGKEHSMEDLYIQIGKHMNYFNKIEKLNSKINFRKPSSLRKMDCTVNLNRISQAKKILKEKLQLGNEELTIEKENRGQKDAKILKYQHLYKYTKPEEQVSKLGPGCYEIRTTLDKKTFNKTVKN